MDGPTNPFDQFDGAPQSGPVYGAPPKPDPDPSGYYPTAKPAPSPLAPTPGGPADPTRLPNPPEGYRYAGEDHHLVPIPGGPKDPNAPGQSLKPDALNDATAKLILTGQMDPMGMSGGPVRLQILNNRSVMLNKYGISDQQLPSIQAQYQSDAKAYSSRVQQLSYIQQATDAANAHFHQIAGYLSQLPAQTNARALNAVSNFAQRQMSGEEISNLDATIPMLKAEIARILTANPNSGAGDLTDDARHEFDILESNVAPQRKIEALNALMTMGQAKINAVRTEIDGLHGRLTGGLQTYAQLAHSSILGAGPGGNNPPPGSTPTGGDTPPTGTDPTIKNVGGFADEQTYSPEGAQAFHDALFSAMRSGQIKSVGDIQAWEKDYNQKNGTDFGVDTGKETQAAIAAALAHKQFGVALPDMTQGEAQRLQQRIATNKDNNPGTAAIAAGVANTGLVGADKSISALADATGDFLGGKGFDYTGNLNADTRYLNNVAQQAPGHYIGGQLAGAFALPSFGARTIPELSRVGAGYGAAYGFNNSAGQPLVDRGLNAFVGGVEGGAVPLALSGIGKGISGVKNALTGIRDVMPAPTEAPPVNANALADAGQAERVDVNRAMVDPSQANKVSAVDRSMVGGPVLQKGMAKIGGQISAGVDRLGNGGNALEPQAAGNTVTGAGLRYITNSGKDFSRQYGSIRQAIGNLKIPATKTVGQIDDLIGKLSEMPNENLAEISWLQGLKQDLNKPPRDTGILDANGKPITTNQDVGISIDGMRGLRTKIRQELAKGDLTFGPEEARVKSLGDAAAQDITNGLKAAGKGNLADRFVQVDAAYKQRMDFIQNTIQGLIGKRGQNLSGEQVAANLRTMAGPRGNASGLSRMMEQMTPEERADTQATFADALGKNNKGDFSTAALVTQAQKLPQATRVAIFGQDGAKSLNNLVMLAKAHAAVAGKMSGSPTGVANDYRSWLNMLVFGGPAELLTHSTGKAAIVAGGAAAIKGGRDIMNARLLLNKDIQRWIQSAPKTTNQRAIDVHFSRLNEIAAKTPALAHDIGVLKQAIMNAANDNVGTAAAASGNSGGDNNNNQ